MMVSTDPEWGIWSQGTGDKYLGGKRAGFKGTVPAQIDVERIRKRLRLTQAKFSNSLVLMPSGIGKAGDVPLRHLLALFSLSSVTTLKQSSPHCSRIKLESLPLREGARPQSKARRKQFFINHFQFVKHCVTN